jgi:hypothetical protein
MRTEDATTAPAAQESRTTFERAVAGYDPEFERALANEIRKAIADASAVTDRNATVVRTREMLGALSTIISQTLALRQDMRQPRKLREMVDVLAKRIKREAAKAIAESQADERNWGHA